MTFGIKLENVTVNYDGHIALSELSLELSAKSVAVIGANGSGKSTFARLLNGLVKPTSGRITVNGLAPNTKDTGFVFSNPDLQVVMPTVFEDVAFSLANEKLSKDDVRIRTQAALAEVGILELQELSCYSLSSGQKQLLALASSLVRKPRLLVADEPTTLLDLPNTRRITKLLHSLDLQQLVVVTHDLELAATCQEVIWFEGGQVRKQGSSKQVIAAYLEACS